MAEKPDETTKVEKPTAEKGGYSAGRLTVSDLPPPPASVSVQPPDNDQNAATEQTPTGPSSDNSK